MGNIHTEEEFKNLLKNLFAEKKRIKALQKNFQTKLTDIQKVSVTEEFTNLKQAYVEREEEVRQLRLQIEKVKPALKKLVGELKEAKESDHEFESLKQELWAKEGELTRSIEQEKKEVEERNRLIEKLAEGKSQEEKQKEKIATLQETCEKLAQEFERKIYEAKEKSATFEDELEEKRQQLRQLDEESHQERKAFALQAEEWETKEKILEKLHADLEQAEERLQESDVAAVHEEYGVRIQDLEAQLEESAKKREELLERGYQQMRELSQKNGTLIEEKGKLEGQVKELSEKKHEFSAFKKSMVELKEGFEERGEEIRRAQVHLAKKVKETTILRDLVERQKTQVEEGNETVSRQKLEMERLENSLHLQKMHEEKLELIGKERALSAETATKEWQEKYLAVQEDVATQKREIEQLQKIKEEYSQMASTFSNLKNVLKDNGNDSWN